MRKSLRLVSPSGCVLLEGREPGGLMRPCQSLNCQHIKSCILFSCVEHLHHHHGYKYIKRTRTQVYQINIEDTS